MRPLQFHLRSLFWLTSLVAVACMIVPPIWHQAVTWIEARRKPVIILVFDGDSIWWPGSEQVTIPPSSSSRPE